MEIFGQYNNKHPVAEYVVKDSEYIVDLAGYVPLQAQILDMQLAGEQLVQNQLDRYFQTDELMDDEDVEEMEPDVTRTPGFDYADISSIYDKTMAEIKRKRTNQTEKTAAATNASETVSKEPIVESRDPSVVGSGIST